MKMKQPLKTKSYWFAIVSAIAIVWWSPATAETHRSSKPTKSNAVISGKQAGDELIRQLIADRLVSEADGFYVEKNGSELAINGKQLPHQVAARYVSLVDQETFSYRVFSFQERLRMHPKSGVLEMVAPVMFSSPCIKTSAVKADGC